MFNSWKCNIIGYNGFSICSNFVHWKVAKLLAFIDYCSTLLHWYHSYRLLMIFSQGQVYLSLLQILWYLFIYLNRMKFEYFISLPFIRNIMNVIHVQIMNFYNTYCLFLRDKYCIYSVSSKHNLRAFIKDGANVEIQVPVTLS